VLYQMRSNRVRKCVGVEAVRGRAHLERAGQVAPELCEQRSCTPISPWSVDVEEPT
jgi:hypothetical protein